MTNRPSSTALIVVDVQRAFDEWEAAGNLPTGKIDGSSSTRHTVAGIALRPGDRIRIEGTPNGAERAALDYIEILAAPN